MIVLHLFVPGRKQVRQYRTWTRLELLRRHGRHVVIDWPTINDTDNAEAIAWCWDRGQTLCTLEQDVEPTLEQLLELEACRQSDVCSVATLRAGSDDEYDFRVLERDGRRWGLEGEQWADFYPLGCTVFRPEAQRRLVNVLHPAAGYQQLDTLISLQLGLRAHIHWPAARHNH